MITIRIAPVFGQSSRSGDWRDTEVAALMPLAMWKYRTQHCRDVHAGWVVWQSCK